VPIQGLDAEPARSPALLDQAREKIRNLQYSLRTEQTYLDWVKRYLSFTQGKRNPKDTGAAEVRAFLTHLAVDQNVAAATQNQALNALLFLYKHVFKKISGDR
jgi:site-specific recombinase XerD